MTGLTRSLKIVLLMGAIHCASNWKIMKLENSEQKKKKHAIKIPSKQNVQPKKRIWNGSSHLEWFFPRKEFVMGKRMFSFHSVGRKQDQTPWKSLKKESSLGKY